MNWLLLRLKGDRGIWLVIIILMLISTLAVYSSTSALAFRLQDGNTEYYLLKHLMLLVAGFTVMFFVHRMNYRWFGRISNFLLLLSIALLTYTLFQGQESKINEASRWITILGQSFQPSDLAKFSLMIYLAKALTQRQETIKSFYKSFVPTIAPVLLICGLIAPYNLSTALLIFITSIVLMYIAGIQLRQILGFFVIGFIGVFILFMTVDRAATWNTRLADYRERLFNDNYEPNYQTVQSNIAIASGGFLGNGAGKSVQRNFLPQPYSDFVYAIIIEEYGFLGGLVVLALYLILLIRSVAIVTISKTFGALLSAAFSFLIVIQALINMGVTVGLLPVTGLPLPLISMGGTSILFTAVSLGIIINISFQSIAEEGGEPA